MKRIACITALVLLAPAFAGAQTAAATVGTFFSYQLAPVPAAALAQNYLVTINGTQTVSAAGLAYNNTTGIFSGTPTTAGTYNIEVQQSTPTAGVYVTSTLALTVNAQGAPSPPPEVTPPVSTCGAAPSPLPTSCAPGTSPCVILSCTPPSEPGATITVFRAVGSSPTFASLATSLPLNCAYIDSAVVPGQSYSYYAETVKSSQPSVPSNTCTVTIPAAPVTPIAPSIAIAFSSTTITDATAVTATITVSGTPTPTGSVTLASGAFSSAAATLANGSASIAIPAGSLDVGALSFTATYAPDTAGAANYTSATGTGTLVVTPVAPLNLTGSVVN